MATADSVSPQPVQARGRGWFPLLVLVLAAVAVAVLLYVPTDLFDRGARRMYSSMAVVVALLLINAWWLFASGFSWRTRLASEAVLLLVLLAGALSVKQVEFTGDMTPILHFRWEPTAAELLEAHRSRAAHGAEPAATAAAPTIGWAEFAEYRGRRRDGVVDGPALARDWNADPPQLVWRQPIGGGYAAFSLADGKAVTIEQRRDREAVVAYDIATGRELWVHAYPALFSETLGGDGPRATPTLADGQVYALGATGVLSCLDLATGEPRWSVNILEQNSVANIVWGMSGAPLVYGELVVVNPGTQGGTSDSRGLVALSRADGQIVWRQGLAAASYSSPMLNVLGDKRQILIFDADGLAGHDSAGGAELWRTPWKTQFDINAAQPVVLDGDRVLISSGAGAALYSIESASSSTWMAQELWKNRSLKCAYACPVERQGFVYGLDEGILVCIDAATGSRQWKQGRYGHGQLLLTGDLLLILSEKGELALVTASPDAYRELARLQAIDGKTWNCPVLVNGRAYIRNHLEMACYDLRPVSERSTSTAADEPDATQQPRPASAADAAK